MKRMNRITRMSARALALLLMLFVAGCGLPPNAKKDAEALPAAITDATKYVGERTNALAKQLTEAPEFKPYAEREKWNDVFESAGKDLVRAEGVFSTEIKPVLDANKNADGEKLIGLVQKVNKIVQTARSAARTSEARLAFLKEARANAPQWIAETAQLHAATAGDHEALMTVVETYKGAYPNRSDDIVKRALPGDTAFRISREAAESMAAEAVKLAGDPDYARIGDGYTAVKRSRVEMQEVRPRIETDMKSLDKSYSKILIDMKAEYTACISRVSWEESEFVEWPTETTFDYPCKAVSEDSHSAAEEFDDRDYDFAVFQRGWFGGKTTKLYWTGDVTEDEVKQLWKELAIDPEAGWPRSDNDSTFNVRTTTAHYFHRYSYIENGVKRDGDWEEVKHEFYDEHDEHLGMSLVEKPHGVFEDETIHVPSPAGMALVGDEKAGKWEQRGANTVWVWWPHYYPLYGGYYGPGWGGYSRSEWDSWRSERSLGKTYTGNGTYGSAGSATRSGGLASSEFAKRGGFNEASAQVRGAGPANRSGGPQRGGK